MRRTFLSPIGCRENCCLLENLKPQRSPVRSPWLSQGRLRRAAKVAEKRVRGDKAIPTNDQLGTLIVTGASRGIGAAIARLASARGSPVAVNYASAESEARSVVAEIISSGGQACAIQADIAREQDIIRLFETAERELGPIKALVNNAGITGGFSRVESITAKTLEQVMAVNVSGAILCAREAVRRMSTRHDGSGGAIVNISFSRGEDRFCWRVGPLCRIERSD